MDVEWLRNICLAFPGATEQIQWGNDLLFKVGGKMFAVTPLEPEGAPEGYVGRCGDLDFH